MADDRSTVTAAQLEAMTPEQRRQHFEASVVTDLDELPAPYRARVLATAERLYQERHPAPEG